MSLPFTLNFSGATYQFVNDYYIIRFPNNNTTNTNASGSITFLTNVNINASIICVAGGGGGGSGGTSGGGGGGGGGGNYQVQQTLSGGTYNITVGYGGSLNGSSSTVISSSGTSIISSTGGQRGNPISLGGQGGSGGFSTPGNGSGGNGATSNVNNIPPSPGNDSWGTITIPNQLSTIIANRYGGGGGAGWYSNAGGVFSGLAGNMGIGGSYSQTTTGQSASSSSFGSGGGGGAPFSSNAGRGANGIVIIYFPYDNYYRIQNNLIYIPFFPVGSIVAYYGSSQPDGWLICDGSAIPSGTQYDYLKNLLGSNNVPNLNAAFLRGAGTYDGNHIGPSLKGFQLDVIKSHNHNLYFEDGLTREGNGSSLCMSTTAVFSTATTKTLEGGSNTGPQGTGVSSGGTNVGTNDTRPMNYGVTWIIKY